MSLPSELNLTGARRGVYRGDTYGPYQIQLSRIVRASIALGNANLLSTDPVFQSADAGIQIICLNEDGTIDTGALAAQVTVLTFTSTTHVVLSSNALEGKTNALFLIMRKNITGLTYSAQIREDRQSTDPIASMDMVSVVNATNGLIQFGMTSTVTDILPGPTQSAVWDLQSSDGGSPADIRTLFTGIVEIDWDVTR